MKPKFKIGQKVLYQLGNKNMVEAVVCSVATGNYLYNYKEPVYTISLLPAVLTTLYESELKEINSLKLPMQQLPVPDLCPRHCMEPGCG